MRVPGAESIFKRWVRALPFRLPHIGAYIRRLGFARETKKLPWTRFERILDAGCGPGRYAVRLARKWPHLAVDGCDLTPHDAWRSAPPNVRFTQGDLTQLGKCGVYDFCLCIDVLEHITDNRAVLRNIRAALREGGFLFLHTPKRNERRFLPARFFKSFEEWAGHEHVGPMYELEELRKMLAGIGFEIITSRETFGFFGSLAWELDRAMDEHLLLKSLLMPALIAAAHFDARFSRNGNGVLVLASASQKAD
jgi:2-polyprenyl-3-methyl-5-hydroxy-6-metoxy-1,4-benzoquinol methylase